MGNDKMIQIYSSSQIRDCVSGPEGPSLVNTYTPKGLD